MVTRPEGFLPTSEAVPFAFEVRATMPGKTGPHQLVAITTISAEAAKDGDFARTLAMRFHTMGLSILTSYREAQEAECPSP